jgi:hypothetical protein
MARVAYTVGALACAVAVGAGVIAASGGESTRRTPAHGSAEAVTAPTTAAANRAAARTGAASLLTELTLPAGAGASSNEPAAGGGDLAHPGVGPLATPNAVDDHAWWLVPGAPTDVLAYIYSHLPPGARKASTGYRSSGSSITSRFEVIEWPPVAGVLTTRWLVVTAAALAGGSTGLRADAQVVWVTPRSTSERIPLGADLMRISVRSEIKVNRFAHRRLSVTSPERIAKMTGLLNALPLLQPGVGKCRSDTGITVRLAFYAGHRAAPLAIAEIEPTGCEVVALTIGGRSQPSLSSYPLPGTGNPPHDSLIDQLDRLLGVNLVT